MRHFFFYEIDLGGSPGDSQRATVISAATYTAARERLFTLYGNPIIILGIEEKADTDQNCRLTDSAYVVRESGDQRFQRNSLTRDQLTYFRIGLEYGGIHVNEIVHI